MTRVAVFVDAGYLFAQGSTALTGSKKGRTSLQLNETAALAALTETALEKTSGGSLLRVYWYDGAVNYRGPTLEQEALAKADNVKLRLGFINSHGQQKGVDSLIVTDLIDLARNRAISDAVLLSGDEDVRIGVQIAQSFGVRVHLLGIEPSRGSQSKQLLHEADTTTEWDKATVAKFLVVKSIEPGATSAEKLDTNEKESIPTQASDLEGAIFSVIDTLLKELSSEELQKLKLHFDDRPNVPPEYDGKLLARCRAAIGRDLDSAEKKRLRNAFKERALQVGKPSESS